MDESPTFLDRDYIWGVVFSRQQGKCNSKGCAIYLQRAESTVLRLREGRGRPTVLEKQDNNLFPRPELVKLQKTKKSWFPFAGPHPEKYEILCRACHENLKPHRVNFKVHPDIFASWTKWKSTHKPDATLTSVILLAMDKLVNRDEWEDKETRDLVNLEAKAAQYDKVKQIIQQDIEDIAYEELNDRAGTNIDADLG